MEYAVFGKTGRKVSRLGFGGATAGIPNYTGAFDPDEKRDREGVALAIRRAYELGVTYFDTAESYGSGASEEIYGDGLNGIPTENIFLASKVTPFCQNGMKSADEIRASLEASLKRLRREYIDLIQIHGSYYTEKNAREILRDGGVADALLKAKDDGLVRHIGFSVETQNTALDLFLESGRFDMMQIQYNVMFQHPYDPSFKIGSMYRAEELGIGIAVMRTMTSGIFQRWIKQANPDDSFDYNPSLLQFVLSNPLADVALVGMRTAEQVEMNVKTADDLNGRFDLNALHNRFV